MDVKGNVSFYSEHHGTKIRIENTEDSKIWFKHFLN